MKMVKMKQKVFTLLNLKNLKRYGFVLNIYFSTCKFHLILFEQQGNPIELRHKESIERGPALDQLKYCINSYREAAISDNPMFDHIDIAEKEKVY